MRDHYIETLAETLAGTAIASGSAEVFRIIKEAAVVADPLFISLGQRYVADFFSADDKVILHLYDAGAEAYVTAHEPFQARGLEPFFAGAWEMGHARWVLEELMRAVRFMLAEWENFDAAEWGV